MSGGTPEDNKYETFVAGVLKDFDSRVQAIQTSAEVNMKGGGRYSCGAESHNLTALNLHSSTAYESYCSELKRELELAQRECEQLREALRSKSSEMVATVNVEDVHRSDGTEEIKLFQSMTCLSLKLQSTTAEEKVYQCQLLDGLLKGTI